MPLCWTMDKLGPICRGVEDTAMVLEAIGGYDVAAHRLDPALLDAPFNYNARGRTKGLRIGFDASEFRGKEHALDRAAREMLAGAGFELVAVKLPEIPMRPMFLALLVEAAASFDEITRSGQDDLLRRQSDDAWPNMLRSIRYLPAVEYLQVRRLRRRAMEAMHDLYERKDLAAFLSPSTHGGMLPLSNFTGHPSLTVRTGFDATGHPHAVTLTGRLFDEGTLVRIGRVLEKAAGVATVRPELPA
jgi:Asp-tRNA(Asn)/Glu-tRNA(Gln) amidotransferase A subunit family amidase